MLSLAHFLIREQISSISISDKCSSTLSLDSSFDREQFLMHPILLLYNCVIYTLEFCP